MSRKECNKKTCDPFAGVTSANCCQNNIIWDDFQDGFSVSCPDSAWSYFCAQPFVGNDGIVTTSKNGLEVCSSGTNPLTGEPAFRNTVPQTLENAFNIPGNVDHVKWLVYANHTSSCGVRGFDVPCGQTLCFKTCMSGETFGTDANPFAISAAEANDDLRLAAVAMNSIDFSTFMVFDIWLTNEGIYFFYERLPFGRTPTNNYRAFSSIIRVASRTPKQFHNLRICYSQEGGLTYFADDVSLNVPKEVIGLPDPRFTIIIDHGGCTTRPFKLTQLAPGMGTFTLLDAIGTDQNCAYPPPPGGCQGLVNLAGLPNFYCCPSIDPCPSFCNPPEFCDELSLDKNRLWGQGAKLRNKIYTISLIHNDQCCFGYFDFDDNCDCDQCSF